jgi:cellulose synthase/poly-beta-1,6-N-acetylglucosamine synthase-like glycosyltransferase
MMSERLPLAKLLRLQTVGSHLQGVRGRMPYPTYSIVIPAYNEAARIGNALQSVVA